MSLETMAKAVASEVKGAVSEVSKKVGEFTENRVDSDKRINPVGKESNLDNQGMSKVEKLMAKTLGYSEPAIQLAGSLKELISGEFYSKELQQEVAEPPKQLKLLISLGLREGKVGDNNALKNPIIETKEFLNKENRVIVNGVEKTLTNLELMQLGRAPIGYDGKPIELHHCGQKQDSTLAELPSSFHRENRKDLHTNLGQMPSAIDRQAFNQQKSSYWKARAEEIVKKGEL